MATSAFVVLGFTALTVLAGSAYFRRVRVSRPPFGVINLRDVAILLGALIVLPYLYLWLPLAVAGGLLGLAAFTVLYLTVEPLLPGSLVWAACLVLLGADIWLALFDGVTGPAFLLVNNAVMGIGIVGASNLWAQSGMKARDAAVLAAVLTGYDLIATWQLPVMGDVLARLSQLPMAPIVAWGLADPASALRIGLGDLLVATLFPLVMRKAFGRSAGYLALLTGLLTISTMLIILRAVSAPAFPVMAFLGPLLVGQYWFWRRSGERTTWQYLQAEPMAGLT